MREASRNLLHRHEAFIGLHKEAVGRDDRSRDGIEMLAEGDMETGTEKFLSKLRFSTETVYYP